MFRELVRKNKQIPAEECIVLLTKETRGVLSVNGDDGYPYGMPSRVRRSRLYYLRALKGKAARIKPRGRF